MEVISVKRYVLTGAAALTLALAVSPMAYAVPNPQLPQSAASPGTLCTPAIGSVADSLSAACAQAVSSGSEAPYPAARPGKAGAAAQGDGTG